MLTIVVPGREFFNDATQEFIKTEDFTLELEHSLVSLSKWESKHQKPFLSPNDKTSEEVLSYVEAMVLTKIFPPDIFSRLSQENVDAINAHIESKESATWFSEAPGGPKSKEVITSELIYYWMVAHNIPFTCETWHLNRLFTLIKVCNLKNAPAKKMSRSEIIARNRALNEQRRAQYGTTG